MEKQFTIKMYNTINEEVEVTFIAKKIRTQWEYTEIISKAKAASHHEFELNINLAKGLFPKMLVKPSFSALPIEKDGVKWDLDTQIKEFFINDPQALGQVVLELMGFMKREVRKQEQ